MIQTTRERFYEKYKITGELGRGAYGTVQKCENIHSREIFAVKHLTISESDPKDYIQLEIDIQKSTHVVKIIEYFIEESNVHLVLEYCNGGTLQALSRTKNFSEDDITNLFLKKFILEVQVQLIQHGIIHRDLKPNNILIHNGQFKLTDFGISVIVNNYDQNETNTIFSRPNIYSSPQMNGKYSSKCDVWSLGMIIYYLLFKKYPWTVEQQNKILEFPSEISDEMKELIKGCLALEEKNRFSWTDLMKRFNFEEYIILEQQLMQIECKVALQIILSIVKDKSTVEDVFRPIFNQENRNIDGKMKLLHFQEMMTDYNKELLQFQKVYIFNQIDQLRNNYIDFSQFQKWINKFYIQVEDKTYFLKKWKLEEERWIKKLFIAMFFYEKTHLNMHWLFQQVNHQQTLEYNIKHILQEIDFNIKQQELYPIKKIIMKYKIQPSIILQFYNIFEVINYCLLIQIYDTFIQLEQKPGYFSFIEQYNGEFIDFYFYLNYKNKQPQNLASKT